MGNNDLGCNAVTCKFLTVTSHVSVFVCLNRLTSMKSNFINSVLKLAPYQFNATGQSLCIPQRMKIATRGAPVCVSRGRFAVFD